jgi:3-hydroxyacyl-CoA dehydrogenase
MKYADTYGLKQILNDIKEFATEDPVFWTPSPLILGLVKSKKNFGSLNK